MAAAMMTMPCLAIANNSKEGGLVLSKRAEMGILGGDGLSSRALAITRACRAA